jgi:hypothetical protein
MFLFVLGIHVASLIASCSQPPSRRSVHAQCLALAFYSSCFFKSNFMSSVGLCDMPDEILIDIAARLMFLEVVHLRAVSLYCPISAVLREALTRKLR